MSGAKRASPRLAEQQQKRVKLSLQDRRVPAALDIVFQHLTDVRLRYKLLQVSFCHFAPLLCKVTNLTAGDKEFLQEWIRKPPDFWHYNPFSHHDLIAVDAAFCLDLALRANPSQFSSTFFPSCLKNDSINCLIFLLKTKELKLSYYENWTCFPIRCLDYLLQNDFADRSTFCDVYLKGFSTHLKRFWNNADSFDPNVARVINDYQLVPPHKLAHIIVRDIYHFDTCKCQLNAEDKLKWLNALLPPNQVDAFVDAVVDELSQAFWLVRNNLACFSNLFPNFGPILLDKLRRHPGTSSYVLLCMDKRHDLPLSDANIATLISYRPLLSLSGLLKYKMTAAQKLYAVISYLSQTSAFSSKELENIPLRKRALRILVPNKVNQFYIANPEANSAHAWYLFQRLDELGYPLQNFDVPLVRSFWAHGHNNCLWPWLSQRFPWEKKKRVSPAAQSWLVNFCLEFPEFSVEHRQARKYRIIPCDRLEPAPSENFPEGEYSFWSSRDMTLAQRVGHLFVWPLVDF